MVETSRLLLEPWDGRWFDDYARVLADAEAMRHLGGPRSRAEAEERFSTYTSHWREHGFGPLFAVEKETGRWVGLIGLRKVDSHTWGVDPGDVEIGWIVAREAWGNGYATEGSFAMRDRAFDVVGLPWIVARLASANPASERVAQKLGMTLWRTSDDGDWVSYRLEAPGGRS